MSAAPKDIPGRPDLAAAALDYFEQGYSIIPLKPGDKVPLGEALPNGSWAPFQKRRPAREQVIEWWQKYPDANIGMLTGPINGIAVVDFDGPEGIQAAKDAGMEPLLSKTRVHKTPRGWHYVYKWAEGFPQTANAVAHVDSRGEGGYIVAPPSIRAEGVYRIVYESELAEPPPALIEKLKERRKRETNADLPPGEHPNWVSDALTHGVPQGSRDQMATRLAGYFHKQGLPPDIIFTVLLPFAKACSPAFPESELRRKIASVGRYHTIALEAGVTDPPHFQDMGDSYRYEWMDGAIVAELRRLEWRSHEVRCIAEIKAMLPGMVRPLDTVKRLDLLSSSVSTLAKDLSGSIESVPWRVMLNDMARLAYHQLQQGEPPSSWMEGMNDIDEEEMYALRPLVLEDGPTMWFGPGGSGKTLFAEMAALDLNDGENFLGLSRSQGKRVLYVDFEQTKRDHQRRLRHLLAVGRRGVSTVLYLNYRGASLIDRIDHLRRVVQEESIGFVIIDSVLPACHGDPLNADVAIAFCNAVNSLGVGSLLLSHVTKSGEDMHPFGSVMWSNLCRATWYVVKEQEEGSHDMAVGFWNRKGNWDGLLRPIGYRVSFKDGISNKKMGVGDVPALVSHMTDAQRLAMALARAGTSPSIEEVAEAAGVEKAIANAELNRLANSGKAVYIDNHAYQIIRVERGKYRVIVNMLEVENT